MKKHTAVIHISGDQGRETTIKLRAFSARRALAKILRRYPEVGKVELSGPYEEITYEYCRYN